MNLPELSKANQNIQDLELPDRDMGPYTSSSLQYGAGKVAAAYCGLRSVPTEIFGGWHHGWYAEQKILSPEYLIEVSISNPRVEPTWVAQAGHEAYLREHGYNARAIGLPFVYLPRRSYKRRLGSLLVMPAHSLAYTQHSWRFNEYVKVIDAVRDDFSEVAICLHSGCLRNGYWMKEFRERGYPIIEGADANDRNSLERVRALMSQFEYVTTNTQGSCIAYAAAYGAKVSLFGPYAEYKLEDFARDRFYLQHPGLAAKVVEACSEQRTREFLRQFFTHPAQASERKAWGEEQLGVGNIVAPSELKRLFKWNRLRDHLVEKQRTFIRFLDDSCIGLLKQAVKRRLKPDAWALEQENVRLREHQKGQDGVARLHGRDHFFVDADEFQEQYERVYYRKLLDFPCLADNPRIIDSAARTGLNLQFWLERFPSARITAIEPSEANHRILAKTVESLGIPVEIHHAELAVATPQSGPSKIRLRELLHEPINFLNLRIREDEIDILVDCGSAIESVGCLNVQYTAFGDAHCFHELLQFLNAHGFRYILRCNSPPDRPMFELKCSDRITFSVDVFAVRETD